MYPCAIFQKRHNIQTLINIRYTTGIRCTWFHYQYIITIVPLKKKKDYQKLFICVYCNIYDRSHLFMHLLTNHFFMFRMSIIKAIGLGSGFINLSVIVSFCFT